jgi:CBS domain-containing membrane protein
MRVAVIMTTRVRTIGPSESAELAWDRMRMNRIHHLVVVRDSDVLGVLTDRDLGSSHGKEIRENRSVHDLMTTNVTTITPETTIRDAANLMRSRSAGCLPVLDRDRRVVGIVTVSDMLKLIGRGVDRPAPRERRILKDRGQRPHPLELAKASSRAKRPTR